MLKCDIPLGNRNEKREPFPNSLLAEILQTQNRLLVFLYFSIIPFDMPVALSIYRIASHACLKFASIAFLLLFFHKPISIGSAQFVYLIII